MCETELFVANSENGSICFQRSLADGVYNGGSWSPQGDKIAICCKRPALVAIHSRDGNTVCSIKCDNDTVATAFSPDGSRIAIVDDLELRVCETSGGREILRHALKDRSSSVAYSSRGAQIIRGGKFGEISVFSAANLHLLYQIASGSDVTCIACNSDDSRIATGHGDSKIRLWDAKSRRLQAALLGHEGSVNDVAFSLDGRTLLSAACDGAVRLWSVEHGRAFGVFCRRFEPVTIDAECRASLSANGQHLAVGYRTTDVNCPDVQLWEAARLPAD
jgi:WD40 repeat protein